MGNGIEIAKFTCPTCGPEGKWEVVMEKCEDGGKKYLVVHDPFGNRQMWFEYNGVGIIKANSTFCHLVAVALEDAAVDR